MSKAADEKPVLRTQMRARLANLEPEDARFAGERITEALRSTREWREASQIALFANLAGEIDTRPIWDAAISASKPVLFPRVLPGGELEFALVQDPSQLEPGRFGVLEPIARCPVDSLDAGTLVLVPGVAFDRQGGRLGRGAGYYDRALSAGAESIEASGGARAPRFGIGFEFQIISKVPMGPRDVRMDRILTEVGLADSDVSH